MNDLESKLPPAVATYLAAEKADDVDKLDVCFTDDALVSDEDHEYIGLTAIKAWKKETYVKYRYTADPLDVATDGNVVRVHVRLTGDFPGSPVEVDYTFTLANDKIRSLEIG